MLPWIIVFRGSGHGSVVGKGGDSRPSCSPWSIVVAEEVGIWGGGVQLMEEMVKVAEILCSRDPKAAAVQIRGPILRRGLG